MHLRAGFTDKLSTQSIFSINPPFHFKSTSYRFTIPFSMSTLFHHLNSRGHPDLDLLAPLRQWLDHFEIHNNRLAHLICHLIPCSCPFERDISLLGKTLHIPALCKLNPLYNEFITLRFRALSYLSDTCGEDITKYIC